jgi:type IV pilus assembly protein PilQ
MREIEEKRIMRKWQALQAALVIGCLLPLSAWAQNAIQSITSSQQAGSEVVRIELKEPLSAVPGGFTIQAPPRIAIDLPGIGNELGRSAVEINQGNLRSVSVAQAGERTRLVLNLRQAAGYRAQLDGKALVLVLDAAGPAVAQGGAAQTQFAPAPVAAAGSQTLKDIDFRRGPNGSGRVVVTLADSQTGVDIRQQGKNLVVEFLQSSLPTALRRKLDVTDFGTPVQTVTSFQTGDRVRLLVEPRGDWEHSAYQADNQFVLEVRPMKVDPNKLTQGPGFQGEKLSLNFQNIEVRALLQVIADFTNFNIVTSDTVTGNVTLRLKDVPWDQALDIILQSKGLGVRKNGNVLWIAPKDELAAKEQLDLESRKKIEELEPLRTQSFQLNYTKAEDVAKGLIGTNTGGGTTTTGAGGTSNVTRILSPRGSVLFEQRTNQLFVTDIPSKLEEIGVLISKIDIPVRQVLIEARIVEADDSFGRSLGIKLGAVDLRQPRRSGIVVGGNYEAIGAQTGQIPTPIDFTNSQMVNLPANTSSLGAGLDAATFALSLFGSSANRFLNLELSALEAEGKGKIVSSPRVITTDQKPASIEQGEEIPYQNATSSGATAVEFKRAALRLDVTPQITPEGNVILDLAVTKDSRGALTLAGPAINTKRVNTQVLVENGGTVVIGGIFTQDERNEVNKVPFLGDIPVVGNLFKNTAKTTNRTELLIFITPKVVTDRSAAR